MAYERADFILKLLRAIRADITTIRERQEELILRVSRLEREVAHLHADFPTISPRIDNLDRRVEQIERRLELVNENAG